jgi:hypothetical protein
MVSLIILRVPIYSFFAAAPGSSRDARGRAWPHWGLERSETLTCTQTHRDRRAGLGFRHHACAFPFKANLLRTARQASVTAPTTTVVSPRATTTVLLFFCLSLVLDIRRRYLTLSNASFLELPAPVT